MVMKINGTVGLKMNLKLREKLALILISLILSIVAILSVALWIGFNRSFANMSRTSSRMMSEELMIQMENRGKAVTRLLAENLINPLYFNDMDKIRDLLVAAKNQSGSKYVYVYDPQGKILHDGTSSAASFGKLLDNIKAREGILNKEREVVRINGNILEIALPVWLDNVPLGGVLVGLSLDDINGNIEEMETRLDHVRSEGREETIGFLVVLTIVLVGSGIALSFFLAGRLVQPIREIIRYAARVGQGEYDFEIRSVYRDELGDLINSFNRMKSDLKETTVSKNVLEKKIEDRTEEIRKANDKLMLEVSIRKKMETELVKHKEELEALINKRTADLLESNKQLKKEIEERKEAEAQREKAQDQLKQAQKMEAIGTLAGGVAHDLNNILSGIISYPELMLMELPADSKHRGILEDILDSGRKAAAIVNDLLTLGRRGVDVKEIVNLKDVVEQYLISPEYRNMISYHPGVTVKSELGTEWMGIIGSPIHLAKTVMNLVTNAAEAMADGGEIFISLEKRFLEADSGAKLPTEKGTYVVLTVSDHGIGISDSDIEKIFDPFFTRKPMNRSGTGLGMAVVWGTVKDHNGQIEVKSTVGKGTRFTLFFPAITREKKERAVVQPIDAFNGNEAILVVDDLENQRKIAEAILVRRGYDVVTAASGEEALEYLKYHSVDLVLLDMIMKGGMDGLDTFRRILEIYPDQKAVVVSGYSETDRIREILKIGAGAFLKKPYLMDELVKSVRTELDRNSDHLSKS